MVEACLNNAGMVPKINPIKTKLEYAWYLKKKYFTIFPNNTIPTKAPKAIENKYKKFFYNYHLFFSLIKYLVYYCHI